MMYANTQPPFGRRNNSSSPARRIVGSIFVCVFLVDGLLLYFFAWPFWQIRLNGVETTALARAVAVCDDDDGSVTYVFSYAFTDAHGTQYHITRDGFCTNTISDGDRVALWYMPGDPHQLLTTPEAILLYIFSGLGGAMDLAALVVLLLTLRNSLRARRRQEAFPYPGMGLR